MTVEPALDPGVFVGEVIVHDHVDLPVGGHHLIDGAQELQPFPMAVPVVVLGDDLIWRVNRNGSHSLQTAKIIMSRTNFSFVTL
jgi:hypothetical protein